MQAVAAIVGDIQNSVDARRIRVPQLQTTKCAGSTQIVAETHATPAYFVKVSKY